LLLVPSTPTSVTSTKSETSATPNHHFCTPTPTTPIFSALNTSSPRTFPQPKVHGKITCSDAFAIAANQSSKIEATHNEYKGKHRNATKTDIANNSAIVIDSGRGEAFQLKAEETSGDWVNTAGKVVWKDMIPIDVASHQDAMKLCLDQLYRKGRYVLILHRTPVKDSHGTFGAVTMFSGLHRAWRLQEPATPGYCLHPLYCLWRG
jgi:hypothetical protein